MSLTGQPQPATPVVQVTGEPQDRNPGLRPAAAPFHQGDPSPDAQDAMGTRVDNLRRAARVTGEGAVEASRRDWQLVAAAVIVVLVALLVVGRLQGHNLPQGDAAVSGTTGTTVRADEAPVAAGLAVAGRVALPGQPVAVAVGEAPSGCCRSRAPCCGWTPTATS
jgi:hypothetical protein